MELKAVIFDLGGVVLGSPLHAIAAYERELGIPVNFVNQVVADTAPTGAWSRLERGELSMESFFTAFEDDCRKAGREISARIMMQRMGEAARPRPVMLQAIARLRDSGIPVAALTNNWATAEQSDTPSDGTRALREYFDVFIESSVEGLRKPDPRIYELTCARLDVTPAGTVFLDDIGSNLKTARRLGMTTIKVIEPEEALADLERVVGLSLLS
jgi:putative hydrolase of the HAD superfamily